MASQKRRRAKWSWALPVLIAFACSGDSPAGPTPPSNSPPSDVGCGLGPIAPPTNTSVACSIAAGCPRIPPSTATTLVTTSTCSFGSDTVSCHAIPDPGCPLVFERPGEVALRQYLLHNPDRPNTICTGILHFKFQRTVDGTIRALWDAQELEEQPGGGCRDVGPHWDGEVTIAGTCCQEFIDIRLPRAGRTYRHVFRTDWNTIGTTVVSDRLHLSPSREALSIRRE